MKRLKNVINMVEKNRKIQGMMLSIVIIFIVMFGVLTTPPSLVTGDKPSFNYPPINEHSYQLMSFTDYDDLSVYMRRSINSSSVYSYSFGSANFAERKLQVPVMMDEAGSDGSIGGETVDYSETNIQVQGVDEPDIVKTDGTYIYLVSKTVVYIIRAYPADEAEIISEISFEHTVNNIFINEDRLVVFLDKYNSYDEYEDGEKIKIIDWFYSSTTKINIYDISDRSEPELKKEVEVAGSFFNARMIGDYVYLITNQYTNNIFRVDQAETVVPQVIVDGMVHDIPISDIFIVDMPMNNDQFTHVVSINIKDESKELVDKIYTLGFSQQMYVSKNNIYFSYQTNYNDYHLMQEIIDEVVMPVITEDVRQDIVDVRDFPLPDYQKTTVINWLLESYYQTLGSDKRTYIQFEIQKRISRTIIHKISIDKGEILYKCNGSVPGRILNQFSMDENDGLLRVATQTDGYYNLDIKKCSNVYVLDENLDLVGILEKIAPGENMHSARFMGEKAYLVTFKNIDPLFVIDLSDPENPEILGELKIPGYSDYLHPYDENHLIGVGIEVDSSIDEDKIHAEDSVYYTALQGVKIAIFDVTDPSNPKEISKVTIGDRGSSTPVLNDHKAFLFDREKELLVIPVTEYENFEESVRIGVRSDYSKTPFQGAYVFNINLKDGFDLIGKITHVENQKETDDSRYYYNWDSLITRSLFINDSLYTISNNMLKINDITDLNEINSISLN